MKHKIVERVGQAHENSTSKASLKIKLDNIDEEKKGYMLHAEKSVAASSLAVFHSHQILPNVSVGLKSTGQFLNSTRRGLGTTVL